MLVGEAGQPAFDRLGPHDADLHAFGDRGAIEHRGTPALDVREATYLVDELAAQIGQGGHVGDRIIVARQPRGLAQSLVEYHHQPVDLARLALDRIRSEEHTSELQSLMRISYAVFCLKTKKHLNHSI